MIKKQPEMDGQGNALRDYVWMGDIPVAMVEYTGLTERVTYLHADHLNTPRYATDETGTLVWQWSSDAFGNGAANENPDGDGTAITLNLRFPGQYYDAESGLHYNWNRYYDPEIGRYITSDPIGLDGGLNTFGYVSNNPLIMIDPYGLAGKGNRGDGSATGKGTSKPYKHCREVKNKPDKITCKRKRDGKWVEMPKPADWPGNSGDDSNSSSFSCEESCREVVQTVRDAFGVITVIILTICTGGAATS